MSEVRDYVLKSRRIMPKMSYSPQIGDEKKKKERENIYLDVKSKG